MKAIIPLFILAFTVAACKDNGQHLGNFKNDCAAKKGVLTETSPNNYSCKLPDGTVLTSK